MKLPKESVQICDLPELAETFCDSVGLSTFDGLTVRLELCVTRLNEPEPPKPPSAKRYPVCRLVLPPDGAAELYNQLSMIIGIMKQKGVVKQEGNKVTGTTH